MQRLKLENRRELRGPTQLVGDDVGGDLGGKRQRESHRSEDSNKGGPAVNVRATSLHAPDHDRAPDLSGTRPARIMIRIKSMSTNVTALVAALRLQQLLRNPKQSPSSAH